MTEVRPTAADNAQVRVTVNGIEAICVALNCDYTYVEATAEISSQVVSGNVLTILGTDLPTGDDTELSLSGKACTINDKTATTITCTFTEALVAGSWNARVATALGGTPLAAGVSPIDVALVITSISPNTDLNYFGGGVLTISGEGFPANMDEVSV